MELTDLAGNALAEEEMLNVLADEGVVLFSARDRAEATCSLTPFVDFYRHPHAEEDGWTLRLARALPGGDRVRARNGRRPHQSIRAETRRQGNRPVVDNTVHR